MGSADTPMGCPGNKATDDGVTRFARVCPLRSPSGRKNQTQHTGPLFDLTNGSACADHMGLLGLFSAHVPSAAGPSIYLYRLSHPRCKASQKRIDGGNV